MSGVIIESRNVFDPSRDRIVHPIARPVALRAWLDDRGIAEFDKPTICLFNGRPVLRADWSSTVIGAGDICNLVTLPVGGGGGDGGSNPLRIVLQVAVLVAASWAAAALGPYVGMSLFEAGIGSTWASSLSIGQAIIGGAVTIAGSLLLSAVLPAPRPSLPGVNYGGVASTPAASPTYSLQAQGNTARLGQPITVAYGRHKVTPDFGAAPYQEFEDNEQYLYQVLIVGQGEYDVEAILIDDTPIGNFEEIDYELCGPDDDITLFDIDVATAPEVSGQKMVGPSDLGVGEDGYIGPFVANPAETIATDIGVDILFSRGLYYANDSGGLDSKTVTWQVEAREIDDDGDPVSGASWDVLGSETITETTNTPVRISDKYSVTPGRYEVRVKRTNDEDGSSRAGHEARWGSLRAYLEDTSDLSGLTKLATKMRATDNLSQRSSRLINMIVTRKLPTWSSADGWSEEPVATRSIAWAAADLVRSSYGGELPDSRIDLAALEALDAVWTSRGDYFDAVFDSAITVWEALTRLLRAGRAVPIQQGGVVRFVRDAAASLPVAMFGPRNIVRNSFEVQWILPSEETADAVTVEYWSDRTWRSAEVTVKLDDSAGAEPRRVTLFGVTDPDQAAREGMKICADNRYRRKFIRFRTELDGMIPIYGDLVAVTHPMPDWGQGGEVTAWTGIADGDVYTGAVLTLSEPPVFTEAATHYVGLRKRDGSMAGPFEVEAVNGAPNKVRLVDDLTIVPDTGGSRERTYYTFGASGLTWQPARVLAVKPRGDQVEIVCVNEDDRAHPN